jgi:release factor glutamine methyltransferase
MNDLQVFKFLSRFASAHDVKVIMQNMKITWKNVGFVAIKLYRKVPVAKIINKKWFYGFQFYTNKYTLDPRPDSETLVEVALSLNPKTVLDLGTGTGCLLCSIIKNTPSSTGIGIDKSFHAVRVARKNVHSLGLDKRIKIIREKFSDVRNGKFDLIISNPPYIPVGDTNVNPGAMRDPKMALFGGKDGLKYYREISKIKLSNRMLVEIGLGQMDDIKSIFLSNGWNFVSSHKDLSGIVRVLLFDISK